jgi:hypothetical protein
MGLADDFKNRFSSERQITLTNPDKPEATTVDAARLALAVTDVQADFEIYAGVVYSDSEPRHVSVGVEGVMLKLMARMAGVDPDSIRKSWLDRLESLAKVTGRNRIVPTTDSILTPSSEQIGTDEIRPDLDREHFGQFIPGTPGGNRMFPTDNP